MRNLTRSPIFKAFKSVIFRVAHFPTKEGRGVEGEDGEKEDSGYEVDTKLTWFYGQQPCARCRFSFSRSFGSSFSKQFFSTG